MADSTRLRTFLRILVVFIVTFDVAFLWQRFTGAYESEFGAHPDEAAHCVTGLFVRDAIVHGWDYARGGFKGSPVQVGKEYAESFYAHYPKVALGVWPPAFHLTQAAWTLPFGTSRFSLLMLMATLAATTATILFEVVRRHYGTWPAVITALVWLCGPLVRESYGMVMAETLSGLTMFGAALLWGRYLDEGRKWDAVGFGLLASAAIMTKGTGLALVLMCGLSILLRWNWRVLLRPSLWVAIAMIVVLAGVWTWHFRNEGLRVGGWEGEKVSWGFIQSAAPFYGRQLARLMGFAVLAFAVAGMLARGRSSGLLAAMTSLVVAIFVFQSVIPVGREPRHIVAAAPAMIILAVAGATAIARQRALISTDQAVQQRRESLWVLLMALLVVPHAVLSFERKDYRGFEPLAVEVLDRCGPGGRVLVCSDASGEGMFISEVAMRDQRPNLFVERGSKSLVDPTGRTWGGKLLRERFLDDAALLDFLVKGKIDYVVLDAAVPEEKRAGYHDQLRRVIADNTGFFWPVMESPVRRDGEDLFPPIRLYRIVRESKHAL